jgi:hypothetical protein
MDLSSEETIVWQQFFSENQQLANGHNMDDDGIDKLKPKLNCANKIVHGFRNNFVRIVRIRTWSLEIQGSLIYIDLFSSLSKCNYFKGFHSLSAN